MDDKQRGHRAKAILEDQLVVDSFQLIEDSVLEEWNKAATTDLREELWYTLKGLHRFKTALEIAVQNGEYQTIMEEPNNV